MESSCGFDARVIPEFDGHSDVVEWWTRTEMMCQLKGVDVMSVVPLRLSKGAFVVWSQLPDEVRRCAKGTRSALYSAFGVDKFRAYSMFISRRLHDGESPDVYLADLKKLAVSFGGVSDDLLICAFVNGLPEHVATSIRASTVSESLSLSDITSRTRMVLQTTKSPANCAATSAESRSLRKCYVCNQPGHFGRECPKRKYRLRCYNCSKLGHIAKDGSGNEEGEGSSAPAPFPQ